MKTKLKRGDFRRVVVAVDPAATDSEDADDTGVIVVGKGPCRPGCKLAEAGIPCPGHGYVFDDKTCHLKPIGWARVAVAAYDQWKADRIVAEVNNGGDMVGTIIHTVDATVSYAKVTATRGKAIRAEPVSALWEQGRFHLLGSFPELVAELTTWTPDSNVSPNRLDALVWGATYLGLVGGQGNAFMTMWSEQQKHDELVAAKAAASPLEQLPRLSHAFERNRCQCRPGQRRYFDGLCVVCGGSPPN